MLHDEKNKFKAKYFRTQETYLHTLKMRLSALGFNNFVNDVANREQIKQLYLDAAENLQYTPVTDTAFEYLHNQEKILRDLYLSAHMTAEDVPEKKLGLLIEFLGDTTPAIEICDCYGFGYSHYQPYKTYNGTAQGIVVSLRGKDFDDPEFLECIDFIRDTFIKPSRGLHTNAVISIVPADCFFPY